MLYLYYHILADLKLINKSNLKIIIKIKISNFTKYFPFNIIFTHANDPLYTFYYFL